MHILPQMKSILTITGRVGMDLIHIVTRGNRKFVLMGEEMEMRGFVVEMKHVTPTMVRNEALVEVEGIDRFLADRIYIPEERKELYR